MIPLYKVAVCDVGEESIRYRVDGIRNKKLPGGLDNGVIPWKEDPRFGSCVAEAGLELQQTNNGYHLIVYGHSKTSPEADDFLKDLRETSGLVMCVEKLEEKPRIQGSLPLKPIIGQAH